jgi:hypothetical protein
MTDQQPASLLAAIHARAALPPESRTMDYTGPLWQRVVYIAAAILMDDPRLLRLAVAAFLVIPSILLFRWIMS